MQVFLVVGTNIEMSWARSKDDECMKGNPMLAVSSIAHP